MSKPEPWYIKQHFDEMAERDEELRALGVDPDSPLLRGASEPVIKSHIMRAAQKRRDENVAADALANQPKP